MAYAVKASFEKLKENLEITSLQKSTASTRQANVRTAVEADLTVLDSFLTGSYMRSTMISPLKEADIDIVVVLSAEYYKSDGQASLLDRVKRALLKTYTKTPKISRNGQAITITFTDFTVDVVPAFNRRGSGYLIPDPTNGIWIETDPKTHIDTMSKANADHAFDLVPIVKMIKAWNRSIGYCFVPFYLELIAIEIFSNVTITNFPSGMRYFFDKGRERIKLKVHDPAGFGGQIDPLRGARTVADAISRFETAYSRAKKAEAYAREDKVPDAVDEWRKIFGNCFPAYG